VERLNYFEVAVLTRIGEENPRYVEQIRELCASAQIESRACTGVGGFFDFAPNDVLFEPPNLELVLDATISLPGLEYGMGAILFVRDGRANFLEICAFGEEWWGELRGFKIAPTT
jgi:hypothetical protein